MKRANRWDHSWWRPSNKLIVSASLKCIKRGRSTRCWWMFIFLTMQVHLPLVTSPKKLWNWLRSLALSPYIPDLAPSVIHLFGPITEAHRTIHFGDKGAVKMPMQDHVFYYTGMHGLVKRWSNGVEKDEYCIVLIIKGVSRISQGR